ncbi:hypothetical protein [Chitinophaga flava]|nr:hypothetical protein [Chitinophaga flava]
MKKLFSFLLLVAVTVTTVNAATSFLPRLHRQAPTMNVEGTANSIVAKLDKSLSLTDKQKPRLLNIVTSYLQQKINILPLQQNNQPAYKSKINSMQNGLRAKLKPLFTAEQYTMFQELKPASFDETNVLSHLFF